MTVRVLNWAGPCIERGPYLGETPQFYVYEQAGQRRRARKSDVLVHLTPCKRCMDHPETQYPRGFDL
jgi:hypothetical protein